MTETSRKTWMSEIPENQFFDYFEAVPGNSGLYKIDLERVFPFQKHILLLSRQSMFDGRKIVRDVGSDKGYFDLAKIAKDLGSTLKILDKEDESLNLYPGNGDYFSIPRDLLRSLARHSVGDLENKTLIEGHSVYDVDGFQYRSISLECWGLDFIHVITTEDCVQDVASILNDLEGLNDLSQASRDLNRGFVLVNRKKNNMAFILNNEKGKCVIDLHYLEALDIYSELKRIKSSDKDDDGNNGEES